MKIFQSSRWYSSQTHHVSNSISVQGMLNIPYWRDILESEYCDSVILEWYTEIKEASNKEATNQLKKQQRTQLTKQNRSTDKKPKVLVKLTKTRSIFIYSQEAVGMNWDVLFIEAAKNRACQIWASWHTGTVQKVWVQALMEYPYRKMYIGSYLNKKFHFLWLTTINSSKGISKMRACISSQRNQ